MKLRDIQIAVTPAEYETLLRALDDAADDRYYRADNERFDAEEAKCNLEAARKYSDLYGRLVMSEDNPNNGPYDITEA